MMKSLDFLDHICGPLEAPDFSVLLRFTLKPDDPWSLFLPRSHYDVLIEYLNPYLISIFHWFHLIYPNSADVGGAMGYPYHPQDLPGLLMGGWNTMNIWLVYYILYSSIMFYSLKKSKIHSTGALKTSHDSVLLPYHTTQLYCPNLYPIIQPWTVDIVAKQNYETQLGDLRKMRLDLFYKNVTVEDPETEDGTGAKGGRRRACFRVPELFLKLWGPCACFFCVFLFIYFYIFIYTSIHVYIYIYYTSMYIYLLYIYIYIMISILVWY